MTLFERSERIFFETYRRLPVNVTSGNGAILIGDDGTEYIDLIGGIAVNSVGYGNKRVLSAISEQMERYIHLSNLFVQEPQVRLAEALVRHSGYDRVFFTNSGTEAIEAAIKLCRKWGSSSGKHTLVGFSGSFHGRTMGSLSLMDREKYRKGYEPFLPDVLHLPFNDAAALHSSINGETVSVFLEFLQGEGGINSASRSFIDALFDLREKYSFLVVADEIQSGIGRTGKFFAFEHWGVSPDLVVTAKPIGGGMPLGALLGREEFSSVFGIGGHGTTFGGNPVACAAGIAVVEEIMNGGLMKRARENGEYFKQKLMEIKDAHPRKVRDVRGFGLMLGMEVAGDCREITKSCLEKGLLITCTRDTVLRIVPPLVIGREEINRATAILEEVIQGHGS